jgi:hypothetical protein
VVEERRGRNYIEVIVEPVNASIVRDFIVKKLGRGWAVTYTVRLEGEVTIKKWFYALGCGW